MSQGKVTISHPDKVLFPGGGFTKEDVGGYYGRIASWMLPWIKGRPLSFLVFPGGIESEGFFSKNIPGHYPRHIKRIQVPTRGQQKSSVTMASADETRDLVYMAGQNVIEFHTALSPGDRLEQPDQVIFDLDPSDGDFGKVRQVANQLHELLEERKVASFVKLTGSAGVHVHVPIKGGPSFGEAKEAAHSLATRLHEHLPEVTTLEQRKEKRGNRVFIDYLRNEYGQTTIAPYSLRARPQAPVATPVRWDELNRGDLSSSSYTLANIFRRLSRIKDPWADFTKDRASLRHFS
ncbi:MAG: non-homologous end-joining DNA ligase [Oceanipulchritudo sp.]